MRRVCSLECNLLWLNMHIRVKAQWLAHILNTKSAVGEYNEKSAI